MSNPLPYDASIDYYALFNLTSTSFTLSSLTSSYRKLSLSVHPDRNPNDPLAAQKFHDLKTALEILSDPVTRASWEKEWESSRRERERRKEMEGRRRGLVEELEKAEKEGGFGMEEKRKKQQEKMEVERLKEEGRRMRMERAKKSEEALKRSREDGDEKKDDLEQEPNSKRQKPSSPLSSFEPPPSASPLETTISLKFPSSLIFTSSTPASTTLSTLPFLSSSLNSQIDSLVISSKQKKKKSITTAIVCFKSIDAAVQCLDSCGREGLMKEVDGGWVGGEPEGVRQWREMNGLGRREDQKKKKDKVAREFDSFSKEDEKAEVAQEARPIPSEESILKRLRDREAERKRLEEEILRQEAEES